MTKIADLQDEPVVYEDGVPVIDNIQNVVPPEDQIRTQAVPEKIPEAKPTDAPPTTPGAPPTTPGVRFGPVYIALMLISLLFIFSDVTTGVLLASFNPIVKVIAKTGFIVPVLWYTGLNLQQITK